MNKLKKIYSIVKYETSVPRPTKVEYDSLEESIRLRGQQTPIIVNRDGIILDGHTRFQICTDLGINPKFMIKDFPSQEEEQQFVVESNLNRRQLNTWQKLMCYQGLIDFWQGKVKAMKAGNAHANKMRSLGEKIPYAQPVGSIAERFHGSLGIGIKEMEYALYIYRRRSKHPGLVNQLYNGSLTIAQVHKKIHGDSNDGMKANGGSIKNSEKMLECPHCNSINSRDKYRWVRNLDG